MQLRQNSNEIDDELKFIEKVLKEEMIKEENENSVISSKQEMSCDSEAKIITGNLDKANRSQ